MKLKWIITLSAVFLTMAALGQATLWTVVQYPEDEKFRVMLSRANEPAGGGGATHDTNAPSGVAQIIRDDENTTIELKVGGLPDRCFLYAIDQDGRAHKLLTLSNWYGDKLKIRQETFMLIVSADDNLPSLPARDRIILYSVVPQGLRAVSRSWTTPLSVSPRVVRP